MSSHGYDQKHKPQILSEKNHIYCDPLWENISQHSFSIFLLPSRMPHCAQEARIGGDEKINIYLQNKSMSLRERKKEEQNKTT